MSEALGSDKPFNPTVASNNLLQWFQNPKDTLEPCPGLPNGADNFLTTLYPNGVVDPMERINEVREVLRALPSEVQGAALLLAAGFTGEVVSRDSSPAHVKKVVRLARAAITAKLESDDLRQATAVSVTPSYTEPLRLRSEPINPDDTPTSATNLVLSANERVVAGPQTVLATTTPAPHRPDVRSHNPRSRVARETAITRQPDGAEAVSATADLDKAVPDADLVRMYLNEIGKVALIDAAKEVELCKRIEAGLYAEHLLDTGGGATDATKRELKALAADGETAREHLIRANLRLVVSLAKRFTGRGVPLLDLIQEGNNGLMRAVEKVDYTKGFKFSTYATWWIRQAIRKGIADQARTIRLPAYRVDAVKEYKRVKKDLLHDLEREPTDEELAKELDISLKDVLALNDISRETVSLNQRVGDDDSELGDFIVDKKSGDVAEIVVNTVVQQQRNAAIAGALSMLETREAGIVRMRFGFGGDKPMTFEEIGKVYKITREWARQIYGEVMKKLSEPSVKRMLSNFLDE